MIDPLAGALSVAKARSRLAETRSLSTHHAPLMGIPFALPWSV